MTQRKGNTSLAYNLHLSLKSHRISENCVDPAKMQRVKLHHRTDDCSEYTGLYSINVINRKPTFYHNTAQTVVDHTLPIGFLYKLGQSLLLFEHPAFPITLYPNGHFAKYLLTSSVLLLNYA